MNKQEDISKLQDHLSGVLLRAFKMLLEEKHLYQSVHITKNDVLAAVNAYHLGDGFPLPRDWATIFDRLSTIPWFPYDPSSTRGGVSIDASKVDHWALIGIYLQSVKTRCGFCGEVSPLNLVEAKDLLSVWSRGEPLLEKNYQTFVFSFRCQSCRKGVEFFMVSRDGAKLTLTGRSPMERVDVPPFIPKKQSRYYSAAIIAFNSGQILPGLFMQRTFIEQYVRDETGMKAEKEVDRVLEQYMTTLHVDFRDRFPSLAAIYSRLSEAIHKADESAELFANSHREIDLHFDAKRLYLLANGGTPDPDPPPPNAD